MKISLVFRQILREIYGVEDSSIVFYGTDKFLPTIDKNSPSTFIGYSITEIIPQIHAYPYPSPEAISVKINITLSFVGSIAEDLIFQTLLFPFRKDVQRVLDDHKWQIFACPGNITTNPIKESGYSDQICWSIQLSFLTGISTEAYYPHFFEAKGKQKKEKTDAALK